MYYVYVLKSSRDNKLYVGCTNNLQERLRIHNAGRVPATEKRKPMSLVFYEVFLNKTDAFAREKWFKTGWGRNHLKKILYNYLKSLGG